MTQEFIQPRFDGARFAEHTLPLDVAADLAAYEKLVIDLAKRLYLQDHPTKDRVPKGFEAGFHLHLQKVDDGCARPLLALVAAGVLPFSGASPSYFERARDLITECIAAPADALPAKFPRDLLSYFNSVGRSLQDGETMELPTNGGGKATLTPGRRINLVLAGKSRYEDDLDLVGTVEEVDWKKDKQSFRLRVAGKAIDLPMPDFFEQRARQCGGKDRFQVSVTGVGEYDAKGDLQKVLKIRSVEVQPDYQIASRLDEISALPDGWHDKQGVALDQEKLLTVYEGFVGCYPEELPLPLIVPTPEGNLLMEWQVPGAPSLDINFSGLTAEFHAFGEDGGDIERAFDVQTSEHWETVFNFLKETLG